MAAALLLALWLGPAAARDLPADARLARLEALDYPYATIGRRTYHMAPGCLIRDHANRIVVPVSAPHAGHVLYRLDIAGELAAIWFLTEQEVAAWRATHPR